MKKLLILLAFLPGLLWSQNQGLTEEHIAEEQIVQLKEGALLVRLKTKKSTIDALRKAGKNLSADKLEREQRVENLALVAAFETYFDFCPRYYFYSHFSDQVREKAWSEVEFLNTDLEHMPELKPKSEYLFTAEVGQLKQDTASYFKGNNFNESSNTANTERYYGSPNMSFEALRIMSDQFIQLRKPFPYYIRNYSSFPKKRKPSALVKKMNKQLTDYWKHAQ